jgi:hypothetical protein
VVLRGATLALDAMQASGGRGGGWEMCALCVRCAHMRTTRGQFSVMKATAGGSNESFDFYCDTPADAHRWFCALQVSARACVCMRIIIC